MTFNVGDIIRTSGMLDGQYYFGVVLAEGFYEVVDDFVCDVVKVEWFATNRTSYTPVTHIVKVEEV